MKEAISCATMAELLALTPEARKSLVLILLNSIPQDGQTIAGDPSQILNMKGEQNHD